MATAIMSPGRVRSEHVAKARIIPVSSPAFWISATAAAVAIVASALTLFVPGVLRGPAVMNGSGQGTALVALFVAVPILLVSMYTVARGSVKPIITWLGAAAYLLYNSVLFLFITPFNQLFLFYVAMFALCFWTLVTVLSAIDVPAFSRRYASNFPARALAVYLAVVGALNALAWLVNVIPAVFSDKSPAFLTGTGLTTNPVYVQDLSFWIPLILVTAVWLWQRRPMGVIFAGPLLIFALVESVSIAVDQWMGSAADPTSPVASVALTPIFALVAAIQFVPLFFYFRTLEGAQK